MVQTTTDTGDAAVFATAFLCQGWILRSPSLSRRGENPSIFSQKREEKSNFEALEISFTNFGRSKKKRLVQSILFCVKIPLAPHGKKTRRSRCTNGAHRTAAETASGAESNAASCKEARLSEYSFTDSTLRFATQAKAMPPWSGSFGIP